MKSLDPWCELAVDPYGNVFGPRSYYGHPFYTEIPSWVHYGDDDSTTRQLFDGVFVGGEAMTTLGAELTALSAPGAFYGRYGGYGGYGGPYYGRHARPFYGPYGYPFGPFVGADPSNRKGLLAEVAPIVAPGASGITSKKEIDDQQVLHVEICVDGKCYKTSIDLAPAIALFMQKLAQWHQVQHAPQPPPTAVVQAVQRAVGVAGDQMTDMLVGGWLSDVGSALGGTLRKLQPVISTVATGVATAYGGPAAGAAAGKLVPMWTGLQANLLDPKGNPKKKAQAQQAIQRVNQEAASDPAAAQALAAAHEAIKNTTVAFHVKETAEKAAAGDPKAQAEIEVVVKAAEAGDPVAKSTWEVIAATLGEQLLKPKQGPSTASGWVGG